MKGKQIHVMFKQKGKPASETAPDDPVLLIPKKTVMHDNRVRSGSRRFFKKFKRRGHGHDNAPDLPLSLDLQTIRTIVPNLFYFKEFIQITFQALTREKLATLLI